MQGRVKVQLSSSLPRLLAQSWSRGFVFFSILLLQWGFTVLPLPLEARAQLEAEHTLLSTCPFFLACLKCMSHGRGNCCFSWAQHSSSWSSPIWELPCFNQAMQEIVLSKVLPFSEICFLPEARIFLQVLSLLMEGYQRWCGERTHHCDGSQQIGYEHRCHLLFFGLAVMSFCLPHVVLCTLIRNTLCCKLTNKGRIPAASSCSQMKCLA